MFFFIVTIHIIVSLFLIAVILLQAGRGGGLAEAFGSSEVERIFGTKSATMLTRLTTICAVIFIFTCLTLALLSARRGRSLIERVPQIPPQAQSQKVSEAGQTQSQTQGEKTLETQKISEEQQVQRTGDSQKEQQQNTESAPKAQ